MRLLIMPIERILVITLKLLLSSQKEKLQLI